VRTGSGQAPGAIGATLTTGGHRPRREIDVMFTGYVTTPEPNPEVVAAYYFVSDYQMHQGKACHHHRVFDPDATPLAEGRLTNGFKPSPISLRCNLDEPCSFLQMRKTFPLTGKVDLVDAQDGKLLGVATRGYKLLDTEEEEWARFQSPGELEKWLHVSMVELAAAIVLDDDGTSGGGSASARFALTSRNGVLGKLERTRLPFFPDPPPSREPGAVRQALTRLLPAVFERMPPWGCPCTSGKACLPTRCCCRAR
jgi:hypothetical protein